jgi:hypothetical protein
MKMVAGLTSDVALPWLLGGSSSRLGGTGRQDLTCGNASHSGLSYATRCKSAMNPGVSSEEGIAVFLVLCSKVIDSLALCYKS